MPDEDEIKLSEVCYGKGTEVLKYVGNSSLDRRDIVAWSLAALVGCVLLAGAVLLKQGSK